MERAAAHDHAHLRRERRLERQDDLPVRHLRRQSPSATQSTTTHGCAHNRRSAKVSRCAARKSVTHKPMCRRGYKTSDCSRGEARRNRMLLGHSTKPGSHRSIAVLASCTSSVPRCSDDSTRAATAEPRKIISPVANSSLTIARVSSMAPSQSPVRAFSFKFDVDHLARESS